MGDNPTEATAPAAETPPPAAPAPSTAPPPRARAVPKQDAAPKVSLNLGMMPEAIIEVAATAPLLLVNKVVEARTEKLDADGDIARKGVQLRYDAGSVQATCAAFKVWLASLNIETSPIGALCLCYAVTIGSAAPDAIEQYKQMKRADIAERKAERLAKERAQVMQAPVNGAPQNGAANGGRDTDNGRGASEDTPS